jgi:hypothetical protein
MSSVAESESESEDDDRLGALGGDGRSDEMRSKSLDIGDDRVCPRRFLSVCWVVK